VVHLKRFHFTRTSRDKIDALVEFPITGLDMQPFLQGPAEDSSTLYDLFAISVRPLLSARWHTLLIGAPRTTLVVWAAGTTQPMRATITHSSGMTLTTRMCTRCQRAA
jgi:hypothetical protein